MPPPLPAAKDRSATAKVRSRAAAFLATGQLEAEVLRTRFSIRRLRATLDNILLDCGSAVMRNCIELTAPAAGAAAKEAGTISEHRTQAQQEIAQLLAIHASRSGRKRVSRQF